MHTYIHTCIPNLQCNSDMDQLSGGEKTMAALALLFSIYRLLLYMILNSMYVYTYIYTLCVYELNVCMYACIFMYVCVCMYEYI